MSQPSPPPPPPPGGFRPQSNRRFDGTGGGGGGSSAPRRRAGAAGDRLLWLAGGLGVLLVAVLANALLHSGGGGLSPIAQAAGRTARQPGAQIAMQASYTVAGSSQSFEAHGRGVYDAAGGQTRVSLSIPLPTGTETVEAVGDDHLMAMRSPSISKGLPPGKPWLGMAPLLSHGASSAVGAGGDASSTLKMLEAAGDDVHSEGEETIRGHDTEHYSGTIEISRLRRMLERNGEDGLARTYRQLASVLPSSIPVEVWVDERGLTRRIRYVQPLPAESGRPEVTMNITMELFGFGRQPKVSLPPRKAVLDLTPLIRAKFDLLDGELFAKAIAPSSKPPLGEKAFRDRGNAICRGSKSRLKAMAPRWKGYERKAEAFKAAGPHTPDEALALLRLGAKGIYRPADRAVQDLLRQFGRLSPPPAKADEFRRFLRRAAVGAERLLAETLTFEIGDIEAYKEIRSGHEARDKKDEALSRKLGFGSCSSHPGGSEPDPA